MSLYVSSDIHGTANFKFSWLLSNFPQEIISTTYFMFPLQWIIKSPVSKNGGGLKYYNNGVKNVLETPISEFSFGPDIGSEDIIDIISCTSQNLATTFSFPLSSTRDGGIFNPAARVDKTVTLAQPFIGRDFIVGDPIYSNTSIFNHNVPLNQQCCLFSKSLRFSGGTYQALYLPPTTTTFAFLNMILISICIGFNEYLLYDPKILMTMLFDSPLTDCMICNVIHYFPCLTAIILFIFLR